MLDLACFESTRFWIRRKRSVSPYACGLGRYCDFLGVGSPDEVLELGVDHRRCFMDFVDSLCGVLSPKTVNVYASVVRSWYRRNGVELGELDPIRVYFICGDSR